MSKAIPLEKLRALLTLDEATGTLYWRRRTEDQVSSRRSAMSFNTRFAGKPALNSRHICGYLSGAIEGVPFLAHRVVYALHYGEWPKDQIDHINGKRDDNRPVNLRCVTSADNSRNCALSSRNTSGRVGVSWVAHNKKWRAGIRVNGKQIWLGLFGRFEDAVVAREEAERTAGYHPNHGRVAA